MLYFPSWLRWSVGFIVVWGICYASPNILVGDRFDRFFASMPELLPHNRIGLGLDLQGGVHLVLEADLAQVVGNRMENMVEDVREILRQERIGYRGLGLLRFTEDRMDEKGVTFQLVRTEDSAKLSGIFADLRADRMDLQISEDGRNVRLLLLPDRQLEMENMALEQTMEVVRRRIDALGTRETVVQRQGRDRILLELPGVDDPEYVKSLLGRTAQLNFHLVSESSTLRPDVRVLSGGDGLRYYVQRKIEVSGEHLSDASPGFDNGRPVVNFTFDGVGAIAFGNTTSAHVNRRLAVVLDHEVISAPVIREAITGGSGVISGDFTPQEAFDLALLLRAGALPAPLEVIEERTVGPSLGAESVELGKWASIVGLLLVACLMVLAYGLQGVFAVLALIVNLVLVTALLSVIGATLTLPGVVGIILTVGMAVDANVLILERIIEEVKKGLPIYQAMEQGFARAFSAILDANVTTLIAGLVLFAFAGGPVKGFALTLSVGIVTSLFSAMMVTRFLMLFWVYRRPRASIPC